jgi:hypothetical protein
MVYLESECSSKREDMDESKSENSQAKPCEDPQPLPGDPVIGSTFDERYELLSLLGAGATGTAYKAQDLPAQTVPSIYPLGGDMRYLVTADGNKIVESRRMHKSILENPLPPAGQSAVMGFHSAVMADIPEDTDVFHVLVRKPSIRK